MGHRATRARSPLSLSLSYDVVVLSKLFCLNFIASIYEGSSLSYFYSFDLRGQPTIVEMVDMRGTWGRQPACGMEARRRGV